jgi:hypothetical protein
MMKASIRSISIAVLCFSLIRLNASAAILDERSIDTSITKEVTSRMPSKGNGLLDGIWVDSFVTIHWNFSPEALNYVPKDSLVVTHYSKLVLDNEEFTLKVMPRILIHGVNSAVPGYDTLFTLMEGSFYISGDTLFLHFTGDNESPPEILSYEFYRDSLKIEFIFAGTEVSPGLWSVRDRSYLWGGLMAKREGVFKRSRYEK